MIYPSGLSLRHTAVFQLLALLVFCLAACRTPEEALPTLIVPADLPFTPVSTPTTAVLTTAPPTTADVQPTIAPTRVSLSNLPPLTLTTRRTFTATDAILDLALIDLTGGGLPDIVASAQDGHVYVFGLDGASFRVYYPDLIRVVAGGDMDNDTLGDLFLAGDNQMLTVAEADVRAGLLFTRGAPVLLPGRGTAVTTLPRNGQQTLLVGTENGHLIALALDFSQPWTAVLPAAITHLLPLEMPEPLLVAANSSGGLAAYTDRGTRLWEQSLMHAITAMAQADLNQDSDPEIIAATMSGTVWAANTQGNELWQWTSAEPLTALFAAAHQPDGAALLLVGGGLTAGQLTALNGSGQVLWQADTGYPPLAVSAADITGDGRLEIVVGTGSGDLLLLDDNGGLRGRTTLPARISRLVLSNLDDTQPPELLAVAGDMIFWLDVVVGTTTAALPPTPDTALLATTTPVPVATIPTPTPTLPTLLRPSYQMQVNLNYDARTAVVTQTVTIPNTTNATWSELVFHAAPLYWPGFFTLDTITLGTTAITPTAVSPAIASTMLTLPLAAPLPPGQSAQVQFRYRLNLPRLDPLGWGPTGNAGWGPSLIQMGDWYPALVPYDSATQRWLTWQYTPVGDPVRSVLADFSVTISTAPDVLVAAPGYVGTNGHVRSYRLENGRAFAFLASPNYSLLEGSSQGIPVRVYVLSNHQSLAPLVLNTAVQALNLFRERFGPYPHNELIIAENGFLTAMEYSAIISLSGFAFNEYNNSFRSLITPITAHEVAHQWWYSAVGNDQILEPWLDEALCMYAELIYYETYHPADVEWWWQYRVHRWNPTGFVDATIYDYSNSPDFVHDLYSQSAYFMRDLRAQMGEANFSAFLRAYYQQYRYQTATANGFFALAQRYAPTNLTPLVERYFSRLPATLSPP